MTYNKWHLHQIQGYRNSGVTSGSLGVDRMKFAREKVGFPPKRVIDFGCGDGGFAVELAQKGFLVVGVDLPEVLGSFPGLPRHDNLLYRGMNLDDGGDQQWGEIAGYHYDVAICLEILEHLLRDFDFLVKVYNILNPEGYVLISVPIRADMGEHDHHLRYYPENSLRKLLDSAGYPRVELTKGDNSLLVVGFKKE